MKLDFDCVRDILLECEKTSLNQHLLLGQLSSALPKYSEDEIAYNCLKLKEAGYISVVTMAGGRDINIVKVKDITFQGHEFLNTIRSPKIMTHSKNIASKIGATSLQAFTQIASGVVLTLIKSELGFS